MTLDEIKAAIEVMNEDDAAALAQWLWERIEPELPW